MNDSVVAEIVKNQRKLEGKRWLIVLMFLIIAAVSFLFDIATGPAIQMIHQLTSITTPLISF